MLNQFYKYMSKKLIQFLDTEQLNGGERFYLQFDNKDNVKDFYDILSESEKAEPFFYQHDQGAPYNTFCINVNSVRLVVAATIDDVTPDYLVTLRNQVSEQEKQWENTALLSICYETLDSIKGGSSDLQKEGMPFNIQTITNYIKEELDTNKQLTDSEKEIIRFHLDKKLEDIVIQTSLWDYADVISLIQKGTIERNDFKSLQLFNDKELEMDSYLKPSEIRNRLEENYWLYENVQRIHDYGTQETELERLFDDRMQSKLKQETWYENDFSSIKNSYDNNKGHALQYIVSSTKKNNKHLEFWEKPYLETKAGKRKRHIIVFNSENVDTIDFIFEFDDFLKKQFIDKQSIHFADVSGKKLKVTIPVASQEIKFQKIKYKHKGESKSTYEFNFLIVPFAAKQLEGIESAYHLVVKGSDSRLVLKYEGDTISFGNFDEEKQQLLDEGYMTVSLAEDEKVTLELDYGAWEDNSLFFTIHWNKAYLPIEIKDTDTKSTPIRARRVWKLKRENKEHFSFEDEKLKQGTAIYYPHDSFKELLYKEKEWIDQGNRFVKDGENVEDLDLPEEVAESYNNYLSYFRRNKTLPSLTYMDKELQELASNLILSVDTAIREIEEDTLLNGNQKGIFKLGVYNEKGRVWLTPLHPLNIAYQLAIEQELRDENVDKIILERLHPKNLLPYIYSEKGDLYRPTMELELPEWHEYENEKIVSVGTANEFLAKVVEEKMKQFVHHFDYLFLESSRSPLLLNVIQINNDKEVVKGICQFLKKLLENNGPKGIIPIVVALYRDVNVQSSFEIFSTLQTVPEVEEYLGIDLSMKEFDQVDVLRFIREHITYYKRTIEQNSDFQYSHISFFKLPTQDMNASHPMDKMESGIALNGLLSSVVAVTSENDYRSGFGLLHAPSDETELVKLAQSYNELAYNMQNEGKNSYSKNKSIVKSTSTEGKHLLDKIYKASAWVTFIDPGVDLEFFQSSSSELLVIHYNDQHTSSDRYDAITVTEKSSEYKRVIENYLNENNFSITDANIDLAIKAFNSINGEWLLSIVGSKGHFAREKISIVSAMKYLEGFLAHSNIIWIPISLEEILRVASAVNLTKSEGIFSTRNLQSSGKHSDDILMMGIEEVNGHLILHFYPVEVKIGGLQTSKASVQIEKTTELFYEHLRQIGKENQFKRKFYRNFFAQILLANAKKLFSNGLWSEEEYDRVHRYKARLINDDFIFGQHLNTIIGKGAVLTFRKNHPFRTVERKGDIINITLLEVDAFAGLTQSTSDITEKLQKDYFDIDSTILLANRYHADDVEVASYHEIYGNLNVVEAEENVGKGNVVELNTEINEDDSISNSIENTYGLIEYGMEHDEMPESVAENKTAYGDFDDEVNNNVVDTIVPLEKIRVPIGTVSGSKAVVNWEFGHEELANRHLFITGRSGQGKTYFIQCLLMELAKQGVSSIIIDYTAGFKQSQLEPEFKENLGDSLEQFIVISKKFPINPFKRHQKEIDVGITITEDGSDVAERLKNIIGSIYPSLGIQQLNSIYQAVMRGMELYDEKMNLSYLRELLEEDGSGPAKTAASQMSLLIDKNPFDYEQDFDWSFLEKEKGKVFVIQLMGYSEDVQKLITEFILWDLWYYKLQNGSKNLPFPVVLDESQRLDFSNHSPSAKILTEGRKFGWSGWFATQFVKGGFSIDQVSRLQNSAVKIFFAPTEGEVSSIASSISQDASERKEWEQKLLDLGKGQCIVYGPIVGHDGTMLPSKPYLVNIQSLDERNNKEGSLKE